MSKIKTLCYLIQNNRRGILVALYNYFVRIGITNFLSDEMYLRMTYRIRFGKNLNLELPETFNEKLNWLKLNDKKQIYSDMVDKYEVKQIVANIIGKEYIVPTYGVYGNFSEIDFFKLPESFVLKCTHDSGSVIICKDKKKFDVKAAEKKHTKGMKRNLFFWAREWPYKNVKPRIIVEKYISDLEEALIVYKVFCFHGEPYLIQVIQNDKKENETVDYYDLEWNRLDIRQDYPNSKTGVKRPVALEEMIQLSKQFLTERPFIRVDWYVVGDKPIFSEFTFFSDAGITPFIPEKWDYVLGEKMNLSI